VRRLIAHESEPHMQPIPAELLMSNLSWRYATKKFDPSRRIPAQTWDTLLDAARLAPSSFGLQPWKFISVIDPVVRSELRAASWNQPQIVDASHLLVFCRRETMSVTDVDRFVDDIAKTRGVPKEALAEYRSMMVGYVEKPGADLALWTSKQVYIALGFFLSAAAMLGIDACPMEGIDPAAYDRVLNLGGTGYTSVVVATAGYRATDDMFAGMKKVRYSRADIVRTV